MNVDGGRISVIPYQMEAPTRGEATSTSRLQINWSSPVNTGSAEIDSYNLQWDRNTNGQEWYDLQGADPYSTLMTGSFTADVLAGKVYQVRIRAHNVHGWSVWSPTFEIKSTGIPDAGLPPTTIINNQNVKVAWTEPNDNYE